MDQELHDKNVTINVLSNTTLGIISTLLDPPKYFSTNHGLSRDWQGLAALCKLDPTIFVNIQRSNEPTIKVLKWWSKNNKPEATVQKLLEFFEQMDRFDVFEDIEEHIEKDIQSYQDNLNESVQQLEMDYGNDVLTDDDVKNFSEGKGHQIFDAFVLFADEDVIFATQLIDTMEKSYNLKLCSKYRDLVGGSFEHNSLIKLLTERCRKLIVVLSPAFFSSEQNKFLYSYTQFLQIEQRQRKVIPCTYQERFSLPPEYRYGFVLEYQKSRYYNFWEKLHLAVIRKSRNETIKESSPAAEPKQTSELESTMLVSSSSLKAIEDSTVDLNIILPTEAINNLSNESKASQSNSKNVFKTKIFQKSVKKMFVWKDTIKSEEKKERKRNRKKMAIAS